MRGRWTSAVLAGILAVGVPAALGTPAQAATRCGAELDRPELEADALRAGRASARGLFVTYGDRDTVLEGGTVVPPDVSSPLAEVAVDRTGLGSAIASPFYSPYSDAAGLPNAFVGTELPTGALAEPSRAKVTGRPPQDQTLAFAGGPGSTACVRLMEGPLAEAAAAVASLTDGLRARVGDVRALAGPRGAGSETTSEVVLLDLVLGDLRIDQVVLTTRALADGADGSSSATSLVSGISFAGQALHLSPDGFAPAGPGAPDASALAAAGIEFVSAGAARHTATGSRSVAYATGPMLRITSPDGRVLTVVLGEASADAQLERLD